MSRRGQGFSSYGPRFRPYPDRMGVLELELVVGGELAERYPEGEPDRFVFGRLQSFRPPASNEAGELRLEIGGRDFEESEWTWVTVTFEPCAGGTRVHVQQGGFEELPADHGAFHGLEGVALSSLYGLWWADLTASLKRFAEE